MRESEPELEPSAPESPPSAPPAGLPAAPPPPAPAPAPRRPPRGRGATTPFQIPWRGWVDVFTRVRQQVRADNLDIVAAGVTFYAVLALGPAFVALVSLYGLVASPADVAALLEPIFSFVPAGGGRQLIEELLQTAVNTAPQSLTLRAFGGFVLSSWSANRGMKALIAAVSLAYEDQRQHGFVRANLLSLAFVLVALVVVALTSVALIAAPHLLSGSTVGDGVAGLLSLLRWPVLFAVVVLGLAALYRWGPTRRAPRWRWVALGAIAATLCWLLFSAAFSVYSSHAPGERTGHDGLDSVIALLLWMYASAWAILLGAELNAEIEHQVRGEGEAKTEAPA